MGLHRFLAVFGLISAAALAVSGCAPVTMIDPPQLELGPPSAPSVTNIKVENGGGEVLYNGPRPADGRIEANPTPQQLDGTLKITRTYSDGSVKEQTLAFDAGKPVKIEHSDATGEYYIDKSNPPATPKFYVGLRPSYEFRSRSGTGIIRLEDGVNILGLIKGDNDSSNPSFKGDMGFMLNNSFLGLGQKWGLELSGSYYNAKSSTNIDTVSNPGRLAFFGPVTGGGVSVGAADFTNVRYVSNYWSWQVEPRLRKSYTVGSLYGKPLMMNSYVGFQYGEDEDDEDLDFESPGIPLRVSSRVMLDNSYYGPEFGFYDSWEYCPGLHFTAGAFAKLNVNNLTAKRSLSVTDGANISGEDSLKDTTVTMGGGLNLGLNYKFAPNLTARVGYEYEYADNTPYLDQDQTHGGVSLKTQSSDIHRIFIGARLKFQ